MQDQHKKNKFVLIDGAKGQWEPKAKAITTTKHATIGIRKLHGNATGGNDGGDNDMERRVTILETHAHHIMRATEDIKAETTGLKKDITTIKQELNNCTLIIVFSGIASLFAFFLFLDGHIDKKIDNLDKRVSIQLLAINDSLSDIKATLKTKLIINQTENEKNK